MSNKLISIGWLSCKTVYLNVPRDEAIRRYWAADYPNEPLNVKFLEDNHLIDEVEFEDEFWAYDVGAPIS